MPQFQWQAFPVEFHITHILLYFLRANFFVVLYLFTEIKCVKQLPRLLSALGPESEGQFKLAKTKIRFDRRASQHWKSYQRHQCFLQIAVKKKNTKHN